MPRDDIPEFSSCGSKRRGAASPRSMDEGKSDRKTVGKRRPRGPTNGTEPKEGGAPAPDNEVEPSDNETVIFQRLGRRVTANRVEWLPTRQGRRNQE